MDELNINEDLSFDTAQTTPSTNFGGSTDFGDFSNTNFLTTTEPTAITPESLAPVAQIDVPTTSVPTATAGATIATAGTTGEPISTPIQPLIDDITNEEADLIERTDRQKQGDTLTDNLFSGFDFLRGEGAERTKQFGLAGVKEKRQALLAINNKILALNAEIAQDDVELIANQRAEEVRDTLLPFARSAQNKLAGDAAILRALKTSEKGVLVAEAMAQQGNITLAIQEANNAVDAKYAPYKENIDIWGKQLEVLQPHLDADEKKQGAALLRKQKLADKEIDRLVENEKGKQDVYLSAIAGGATAEQANPILEAQDVNAALRAAGTFIGRQDRILKGLQIANEQSKLNLSNAALAAEAARITAIENGTGLSFADLTGDQQDTTLKLRKEYGDEDQTKEFTKIRGAYNRVVASAVDPSPAGDLALIFNYMKVLDPGSTVREGEFATAQNSAGATSIIRAKYNQVLNGKRLAPKQRKDFVDRAGGLFAAAQTEQDALNRNYAELAGSAGLPVQFITRSTNRAEDDENTAMEGIYSGIVPDQTSATSILDNIANAESSLSQVANFANSFVNPLSSNI